LAWQQLTFRVATGELERAEAFLELAGAASIGFEDAGNGEHPVLEPVPGTSPLWPAVAIRALFPGDVDLELLGRLLQTSGMTHGQVTVAALPERDWRTAGRTIPARAFGRRLWLRPADDLGSPPGGRTVVTINMGLAFGTGQHATTALCLEWLDTNIRAGANALDYGCGSGVLAVAALALGASRAWAVDNDPQAITATLANAERNGVAERLWVGRPEELPNVRVDCLVANILAGPLTTLADTFAASLQPHGRIALSGILAAQRGRVVAAYAARFRDFATVELDGWLRLEARLRDSASDE
jgi:ribosomal protein L11 methyltransferase